MTFARSYAWFLNFFSNGEGLDCLSRHVLPKLSKITVTCPTLVKGNKQGQFCFSQSQQNEHQLWTAQSQQQIDQFENLYISSYGKARNIKFGQQVNIIERVPLGTPPQEVMMSLAHNHLTNLFVSSWRGLLLSNLGNKSNFVIEVDRAFLHWR